MANIIQPGCSISFLTLKQQSPLFYTAVESIKTVHQLLLLCKPQCVPADCSIPG